MFLKVLKTLIISRFYGPKLQKSYEFALVVLWISTQCLFALSGYAIAKAAR
jgi:hypothetical protein